MLFVQFLLLTRRVGTVFLMKLGVSAKRNVNKKYFDIACSMYQFKPAEQQHSLLFENVPKKLVLY